MSIVNLNISSAISKPKFLSGFGGKLMILFTRLIKFLCLGLIISTCLLPKTTFANEEIQLYEQEIKAGLLYNFLKYTNWPAANFTSPSTISICIFGEDSIGGYLETMQGRSVNQRNINIMNIANISEVSECQILFVTINSKNYWRELHAYLAGKNILTISDIKDFTALGGMVEFTRKDKRINIMLNKDALNAANLSIQDRLLKLVTITHNKAAKEQEYE